MKAKVVIEATCNLSKGDFGALQAATPEDQLATMRLNGGKVASTVEAVVRARKPKAEDNTTEPTNDPES